MSKFVTFYTVDPKKHFKKTNSGNGSAVPQYELIDEVITPKKDKDGKQVYHSLYQDIQNNKSANDYKKILEQVGLDNFPGKDTSWKAIDVSDIGTYNDLVKSNNKVQETLRKYDVKDLNALHDKLFKKVEKNITLEQKETSNTSTENK